MVIAIDIPVHCKKILIGPVVNFTVIPLESVRVLQGDVFFDVTFLAADAYEKDRSLMVPMPLNTHFR